MKKQNVLILILLATFTLGACDMLNIGGSNLVGTWDISSLTAGTYSNGSLEADTTVNDLGTLTFNKAGDGLFSITSESTGHATTGTFDWFEKDNKVFINPINLTDSIMTKNLALGFEVKTNTSTQQVWTAEFSYYTDSYVEATDSYVKALYKMSLELELNKQ
jgi:hypothetical protein